MIINGKELKLEITFNTICQLEDMGVSLGEDRKTMSMLRGFVAIGLGISPDEAGVEIEKFVEDGGDITELVKAMSDAMENSGFFQSLAKKANAGKETHAKVPAKKA
nr:MAG TPA: tail assembly chaperone protein [Bacteriophage sp.]